MSTEAGLWRLYGAAGRLASPLAAPYLARRAARGKEEAARAGEKRGIASAPAFDEAPVWLHAVSVGESVAATALAEALVAEGWPVVLTTATPTAAARVAAVTGPRLVHQYAPLDTPPFLARFLDHWRPRAALFTESEVWPTTLLTLSRRGIAEAHVNARLSDRSFARWAKRPALAHPLFAAMGLVLAQSERQAERFATLGAPDVRAVGNMKFDAPPPVPDAARLGALREATAGRPVWLAASTHPGEEEMVLAAHRRVSARHPGVLTIIAPRHPERGDEVAALAARTAPTTRMSRGEAPTGAIHLVDEMGALGTFFALAPVVFLGGSLVPLGGHNPAEPAALDAALLTGPSHGEMFEPFIAAGAARVVADRTALGIAVSSLLASGAERAAVAELAAATLEAERGVLAKVMAALAPFLAAASEGRRPQDAAARSPQDGGAETPVPKEPSAIPGGGEDGAVGSVITSETGDDAAVGPADDVAEAVSEEPGDAARAAEATSADEPPAAAEPEPAPDDRLEPQDETKPEPAPERAPEPEPKPDDEAERSDGPVSQNEAEEVSRLTTPESPITPEKGSV
ncbi:3-deoxy-D-manno-octulosonic acid transferase [Acuticoccus mangrovi]|uniref:3-deoxy-D-manno-octulosonic acid transferase n=1 Tax=Acuticoccus mangrovi TaxID=2796142 RepID=A0A934MI86_9HYPH|nr:3-deoxy-D-manno-octulosonic acid transferase [Acuticoccus mangrovi]MBJ3777685.1 3-deoxy-D-manno-octulosonic acid transferase [Acuticoccus mangrovi]